MPVISDAVSGFPKLSVAPVIKSERLKITLPFSITFKCTGVEFITSVTGVILIFKASVADKPVYMSVTVKLKPTGAVES